MCKHGDTVVVAIDDNTVDIDRCIAPLVALLNASNVDGGTIASCCGHGNKPGRISLASGREIILCRNYEDASAIDAIFPDIHGPHGQENDEVHVVPIGDQRGHDTSSSCWCGPVRDAASPKIWIHKRRAEA